LALDRMYLRNTRSHVRTAGYAVVLLFDLPLGAANFLGVMLKVKKNFSEEDLSFYFTFFKTCKTCFSLREKRIKSYKVQ
jgi:hypothetical protein